MTTQITTTNIQPAALAFIQGPVVSSIQITNSSYTVLDDTAVDTAGGYIKITGVNFVAGMNVIIGSVTATSVSVVSSTVLNVQVPAQSAGSYIVYVTAPDGGVSIVVNGLTYSGTPTWVTGSTLTDGLIDSPISIQLDATDATSYALAAGSSLPSGLTLSSGGLLSGTVTGLSSNTLYNFTINAIDAQLQDSPRAFSITIVVGDTYWKYVDTLLSANTPSSTFISDASTNQFLITPAGDTRPNNFSPYTSGYYSNYFDGTGDYLTVPDNAAFEMTGDFTVEAWFYPTSTSGNYQAIISKSASGIYAPYIFYYRGGLGTVQFSSSTDGASYNLANYTSLGSVNLNTWNHVAASRTGSNVRLFLNGTLITTITNSSALYDNSNAVGIGGRSDGSELLTGYVSNVRIVKGTGLYTASFTPSTTPLTAVSGTSLLTCLNNNITDSSTNNFTITRNGDVTVNGFDPFTPNSSYSTYGSGYFDGSGDYLSVGDSSTWILGNNFTIEAWVYFTTTSGIQQFVNQRASSASAWQFLYNFPNSGDLTFKFEDGNVAINRTWSPVAGQWYHIAVTRNSNTWYLFSNGVQLGATATNSTSFPDISASVWIGLLQNPSSEGFSGYISDLRIVKSSVYTSNFTPPTAPLTAIANTSLLTLQNNQPINNNKFLDQSTNNFLMTAGGNAHQGAFNPYTGAWSNYFDGTTDMLTVTDNTGFDLSSGDFTVECWIYRTGDSGQYTDWICGKREAGGGYRWSWNTGIDGSNKFYFGNGSSSVTSTTTIALNTWYHTAVVRSGSTITVYINGTSEATGTLTVNNYGSDLTIGNYPVDNPTYTGFISNLRIVKGTAVYTSNFTTPASPLTPITNTQLLTCQSVRFVDNSFNRSSITRSGDVTVNKSSPFAPLTNYTPTSYSGYFDGTGDYLSIADNVALEFGSSTITVECWFYMTGANGYLMDKNNSGTGAAPGFSLYVSTTQIIWYYDGANNGYVISPISTSVTQNAWHHIALVRSVSGSTTNSVFLDGVRVGTSSTTNAFPDNSQPFRIGATFLSGSPYAPFTGYISNVRLVKGTAVYDPTQSTITVPTSPLTAIANTSLLTCQNTIFIDNSTNNFTITASGNSQPTIQNPFGYTSPSTVSYTPATYGGSTSFDGTGDNITTTWNNNLELGSGNFTIEFWIYPQGGNSLFCWSADFHYGMTWNYGGASSNRLGVWASSNGSSWDIFNADGGGNGVSTGTITINQWSHVALVRNGSAWALYVNGVSAWTGTSSATIVTRNTDTFRIGGAWPGSGPTNLNGFLTDFRIVKGQALYTSQFVPPASPLASVQNTVLLVNGTNAGIYDSSMVNNYQSFADTRITTSLEKYGNSSIYFDGTGDYLSTISNPALAPRTGDFTWEAWIYFPSGSSYRQIFSNRTGATSSATNGSLAINLSNGLTWYTNSAIVDYTTSIGVNQWVHVAVCRSGTTLRVFANGTSVGSATNSQNLTGAVLTIGANNDGSEVFTGYIDDVRITNGIARYTSNFTPTTSPFLAK